MKPVWRRRHLHSSRLALASALKSPGSLKAKPQDAGSVHRPSEWQGLCGPPSQRLQGCSGVWGLGRPFGQRMTRERPRDRFADRGPGRPPGRQEISRSQCCSDQCSVFLFVGQLGRAELLDPAPRAGASSEPPTAAGRLPHLSVHAEVACHCDCRGCGHLPPER